MKSIRLSTLVAKLGKPVHVVESTSASLLQAEREKRLLTVHHGDYDPRDALWGVPGYGRMNVEYRLIFPQPIPPTVKKVIGIKPITVGAVQIKTILFELDEACSSLRLTEDEMAFAVAAIKEKAAREGVKLD